RAERNGVIYLAVALLSLLIIAIYFYREKVKSSQTILLQKEALTELNETKDKLFSVVSHDLRTAVSSLKTNQTKLQKHYVSGEFQKVESIIASGNAMANGTYNLLDNLFQWALLQTNQAYFSVEPLKLFYIVEQVAYNYEGLFDEKEIIFSLQIPKQTIVFADQETLKITLRNLIDNAIKYTNRGGSVNIYVARQTHENCNLIIEDNGIGISEEAIALLTNEDRLSEARRKGYVKGSGIGLQLCQKMIERNHGQFKIESKKGEGTRIILTLMKIYQQANGKN
ncbi:MAG: HAMP domain-containing sensor histidine kinase, partial [Bacteroidota bacterium]